MEKCSLDCYKCPLWIKHHHLNSIFFSLLRFRCLLCAPDSSTTVSSSRASLTNLKRHVWRKHRQSYQKLDTLWKANLKVGGKKKVEKVFPNFLSDENMFESEENLFEDDDGGDDSILNEISENHFEDNSDNMSEKYPWDFLENSGFFSLAGSSLQDLNDRTCILVKKYFKIN